MTSLIKNPTHVMTWAGISLTTDPRIKVLAEADFGSPAPIEEAFPTGLFDGDYVTHTRDGNREIKLLIRVKSTNGVELAALGESLAAQLYKPTTLVWTPPQGNAPTGVYDVLTSSMVQKFDDVDELHTRRVFELRLVCAPYVRSANPVTIPALAVAGGSQTVIADGTSATGWTSTTGTITAGSGVLTVPFAKTYTPNVGSKGGTLKFTTAVTRTMTSTNFSTTPYVSVDIPNSVLPAGATSPLAAGPTLTAYVNGNPATAVYPKAVFPIATILNWQRVVFLIADPAVTSLTFTFDLTYTNIRDYPGTTNYNFDNVMRSPSMPVSGSNREGIYNLAITGSMRTPGSLTVKAAPLGTAADANARIVYTSTDLGTGNSPALRPYRASGGTTTGSVANFSGSYDTWATGTNQVYSIPANTLPSGGYGFFLSMTNSTGTSAVSSFNITRTIKTFVGSTQVGKTDTAIVPVTIGSTAKGYAGNGYTIVPMGGATLPPNLLDPQSTGTVQVTFTQTSGSDCRLDEAFAFFRGSNSDPTKRGALTIACGVGLRSYLWIDSPDLSNIGRKQIWTGDDPDRADAFHAGSLTTTWGNHEFTPTTLVFVADLSNGAVTGASPAALTSFTYYPHWHSNAAS